MNQLLLGAVIPYIIAVIVYAAKGFRASLFLLMITPVLIAVSMLWAIIPDIPRLLGMSNLYMRLATDPRCNIFYWHYSIDMTETDSRLYYIGFILMAVSMIAAALRELAKEEDN